jgi:Uma2 family endonuclease
MERPHGEEREKGMLPTEVKRHRFTVEEYHRMAEVGLLSADDRVELIDGEIVEMTPIGWRHANCVNALNMLLARFAQGRYVVSVQNPLTISEHGEPQPDLVLLKRRPRGRLPDPEDVALVIEVSDTTLAYDRDVKLPRYARAGVPEVWIVDLVGRRVESHSAPSAEGYRVSREFGPGERARSVSLEGLSLPVDEILE